MQGYLLNCIFCRRKKNNHNKISRYCIKRREAYEIKIQYRLSFYCCHFFSCDIRSIEISIATKGNATKEEIYYLKEVDGYVVVYKEDKETIFEVTSIRVEALPEEIKAEVRNEKKIEGTKKLYGFLENYSS